MKSYSSWVMALGAAVLIGGCAAHPERAAVADGHTSQVALDWAGGYSGQMPAANGRPAQAISLWLSPGNAYRLDLGDWGARGMQSFTGKVAWQDGRAVDLVGAPAGLTHWQVREGSLLGGPDAAVSLSRALPLVGALALPSAWVLESLTGTTLPAEGKRPELSFSMAGRVAGFDGCNRLMGGYTADATGKFQFKQMASTMMACVRPDLPDRAFRAMLEEVMAAKISGETLSLYAANGAVLAQLRAVNSQPLPSESRKNSASRPD